MDIKYAIRLRKSTANAVIIIDRRPYNGETERLSLPNDHLMKSVGGIVNDKSSSPGQEVVHVHCRKQKEDKW